MFEAYFDESGTHDGAPILSVAACVGTQEQWSAFLKLWGNPRFHAKERDSDPLKPKLLDIISKTKLIGMICFVKPAVFENNVSHQWKSALGNAYATCLFACALQICENCPDGVSFVIEDGQPNSEWVLKILRTMSTVTEWEKRITSVALVKKRDFVQLHAADFLAHSWSTSSPMCADLKKTEHVFETDISTVQFGELSKDLQKIVSLRRRHRRLLKKQRKNEKTDRVRES